MIVLGFFMLIAVGVALYPAFRHGKDPDADHDPMHVLRVRLAKGEITHQQYQTLQQEFAKELSPDLKKHDG